MPYPSESDLDYSATSAAVLVILATGNPIRTFKLDFPIICGVSFLLIFPPY